MTRRPRLEVCAAALACVVLLLAMLKSEAFFGQLLRGWDAQFYYAAARSMVFDGDLDVRNDLQRTPARATFIENGRSTLPVGPDGRILNKYPIGTSLLETIPLLVSRIAAGGQPSADGYAPWQIRLTGAWLVLLSGLALWVTARWLQYAESPPELAWAATALVLIGTSQLYYAAVYPFMSHGVSALFVAATLCAGEALSRRGITSARLVALAASATILVLIRPQQATLVLLLGAALAWSRRRRPRDAAAVVAAALAAVGLAVVIQSTANWFGMGQFRFNAYAASGEGFSPLRPDLAMVLLSPGRGLLFLAPLTILALPGAITQATRGPVVLAAVAHLLIQIWLIAAWSSPGQGDAFGARMLVDLSPVLALGVAAVLGAARRRVPTAVATGLFIAGAVAWTTLMLMLYVDQNIPEHATYGAVMQGARDLVAPLISR